jgi:uncharacterized damage-inducible protein DinB
MSSEIGAAFLTASKRHLLEESWPRLQKAVPRLDLDQLWHRENERTNSVGHLLLHLSGNVRQWIVSGLGGAPDERRRSLEFSQPEPIAGDDLMRRLEATLKEAAAVLDRLDPDTLLEPRSIQGYDVTGLAAVLHVVEHFSYHVGQITHMVKALRNEDLAYYEGENLERLNPNRSLPGR